MANKMLIDASHPEETRVVVLRGNRVEEFDFESASKKQLRGNIYLAKVTRVEPSLQAAFVDYGGNRHGFLAFSEIHPDYYQIPVVDRQALIEEEARAQRDEDDDEAGQRRSRRFRRDRDGRGDRDGRRAEKGARAARPCPNPIMARAMPNASKTLKARKMSKVRTRTQACGMLKSVWKPPTATIRKPPRPAGVKKIAPRKARASRKSRRKARLFLPARKPASRRRFRPTPASATTFAMKPPHRTPRATTSGQPRRDRRRRRGLRSGRAGKRRSRRGRRGAGLADDAEPEARSPGPPLRR